jgi:cytidylate kinase
MVIAIDGPAGAGKSTVARAAAVALEARYLDSGAMYRCVALAALRTGVELDDGVALEALASSAVISPEGDRIRLDGEDVGEAIRAPEVSSAASRISVHAGVREAMVARQRELLATGRWVCEGRDIGTVVRPDAPLKVFLTATDAERARRRATQTGEVPDAVRAEQDRRDARDRERLHGPLRSAPDAVEIETSGLEVEDVVARVVELASERGLR